MYGLRRSSPRPSPSSSARLPSLTCEWISATSLHGTRTRPPPPNQAAIRPSTPARPRQTAGTAENRDHFELLAWATLEREIVDLPAAPVLRVEQLMVEDVQPEVDRLGQFWPTFVRIISGTAVNAITMITTKYTRPRMFPRRPFVYSRMYARSFATRKMGM